MAGNEEEFDPMVSFRKAKENQAGLRSLAAETFVPNKEETKENASKQEQPRQEKTEEKGIALENDKTMVDTTIELPPKFAKVEKKEQKRAAPPENNLESEAESKIEVNKSDAELEMDPKERKTKLKKLKATTSKVLVSQGDRLQSTLATVIFDWRGESGLGKAEKHRDLLLKKAAQGNALDEKERQTLVYAQNYIKKHEDRKEGFQKEIPLSEEDKHELIELLGDYLEVSGYQPSPLLIIAGIVLVTLLSNLYTAFTAHPKYNPPI